MKHLNARMLTALTATTLLVACKQVSAPPPYPTPPPPEPEATGQPPLAEPATARTINTAPVAKPEIADFGVPRDALMAAFRLAVEQASPFAGQKAVCFSIRNQQGAAYDVDPAIRRDIAAPLKLPDVPGSKCAFDLYPYVLDSGEQAMLYTVTIVDRGNPRGPVLIRATAAYGNLGAQTTEYQLSYRNGTWVAKSTGLMVVS